MSELLQRSSHYYFHKLRNSAKLYESMAPRRRALRADVSQIDDDSKYMLLKTEEAKMHFAKASAITALSSFVFVSAAPSHEKQQADVACHTSDSSPTMADVTGVVNQLYNRGGDCAAGSPGELPMKTMSLILPIILGLCINRYRYIYIYISIYVNVVFKTC